MRVPAARHPSPSTAASPRLLRRAVLALSRLAEEALLGPAAPAGAAGSTADTHGRGCDNPAQATPRGPTRPHAAGDQPGDAARRVTDLRPPQARRAPEPTVHRRRLRRLRKAGLAAPLPPPADPAPGGELRLRPHPGPPGRGGPPDCGYAVRANAEALRRRSHVVGRVGLCRRVGGGAGPVLGPVLRHQQAGRGRRWPGPRWRNGVVIPVRWSTGSAGSR